MFKLSATGRVLMALGKAGVAGNGTDTFNEPNDVITAPNGDVFVSDGHSGQQDNPPPRVLSFIPPHQTSSFEGAAGEGVAVDFDGNVYAAEGPISRPAAGGGITKYLKR